ncbi:glycosyltransferase family 2 protein [Candidatus Thiosymbion oneisti]|uniref:glycosyltransferase family 2 protein n=1 Tax=Candidatus Thiosymbion oneisti TaxID=589554 RepID=UPI000B7FE0DF|nr:glycosyltransferase [Candidatus Thiosymbion oneisti]
MHISVVVPTFNRAHTLPRALDSILRQSLPATEIIVVDDGSQDDTGGLIRRRYPQVRYLRQPNGGVSSARNRGISAANGDWIALLDSDDAWLPDKLAAQRAALGEHPDIRLCHTQEIWIRHGRQVNQMDKHAKSGGYIFRACLPRCVISPSATLLHRSLFDELGIFDEDLPACEDYDLWLRICATEPVAFVPVPQIRKYGGHVDQLSRKHWGMDRFRIRALEKIIGLGRLDAGDRAAACAMLVRKAGILAAGARKRGHTARAAYYEAKQQAFG